MNKIIKYSIAVLFGLIVLAIITPEQKVIYKECSCADQELKITKLKKVIRLDNEVFGLTGDFMGELDYWLLNPVKGEKEVRILTGKINKIAEEKSEILNSLDN